MIGSMHHAPPFQIDSDLCDEFPITSGDPEIDFIHSTPVKSKFPVASAGMFDFGEIVEHQLNRNVDIAKCAMEELKAIKADL